MHWQLADYSPEHKGVSVVPIEAAANIDVHSDWRHLTARNTDRLDTDAMLVRKRRRQQQTCLNRQAHAFLFLEHTFLQYPFHGECRVGDLELRAGLNAKLSDHLPVLDEAIVEYHARRGDGVVPASTLKVEIAELDFKLPGICNGRVGGYERAIRKRRCRDEENCEQRQEDRDYLVTASNTNIFDAGRPFSCSAGAYTRCVRGSTARL